MHRPVTIHRMSAPNLTRRERVREQTLREIEQHALAQVAEGGVAALSLNAIAKAMGMSGPAIYRYFGSRDELLAALITDGYRELGESVTAAGAAAARRPRAGRTRPGAGRRDRTPRARQAPRGRRRGLPGVGAREPVPL